MSHSKRNTSLAFFTAHERASLRNTWGSQSTHLTRESFLPFASCQLCLLPSREPVACPGHGHVFCRECAISNLLAQNREMKRLKREGERAEQREVEEEGWRDEEVQRRAVVEFEGVQAGLMRDGETVTEHHGKSGGGTSTKRKFFQLDGEELQRRATSEREMIRRKLSDEHRDARSELPSFWVPGETPENHKADVKEVKSHPTCPASAVEKPHEFSLKTLVGVKFFEEQQQGKEGEKENMARSCPACKKALSNGTKAVLAKPCGHVLCKPCSGRFQRARERSAHDDELDETVRCYVCQEDVTPGRRMKRKKKEGEKVGKLEKVERGLVELCCEGTGFAGGGKNVVKKDGLSFQC